MPDFSSDIIFYLVTGFAVLMTGISKSGFGGIALLSVPVMSLIMSPIVAAAIMLPLLLIMDLFSVFAWRKNANWGYLSVLLPGAQLGIVVGAFSASYVSEDIVRLIVGVIAIGFFIFRILPENLFNSAGSGKSDKPAGVFWGSFAGFTSYIAHAGSPPLHIYLIPKNPPKDVFAATCVWFFMIVNLIKLPAFILTGQLNMATFYNALLFVPLVPIGVYLGLWLNRKISHTLFYRIIMTVVLVIGVKLIYDGTTNLLG